MAKEDFRAQRPGIRSNQLVVIVIAGLVYRQPLLGSITDGPQVRRRVEAVVGLKAVYRLSQSRQNAPIGIFLTVLISQEMAHFVGNNLRQVGGHGIKMRLGREGQVVREHKRPIRRVPVPHVHLFRQSEETAVHGEV